MNDEVIWVRMGDMAEYESLGDDFDALGGYLATFGVQAPFTWFDCGLAAGPFGLPQSHISIYRGPRNEPEFARNLTARERRYVEKAVDRERAS